MTMKKLMCYLLSFVILLVCWTSVMTTPFIVLATGHFIAMYLIAKGVK